jgi:dimethylaniline monooxygenase (N-oxide forming)
MCIVLILNQYIDTLCRELGIRTNRKSNPISEMFTPYRPSDYNGLIDEFRAAQGKNRQSAAANGKSKKAYL